jgi:adenylate kinase
MERGTDLGNEARPILARGGYLPDELMLPILADWLTHQNGGWVLDGFPRSLPQAKFLDDALARRGRVIDVVISLEAPLPELLARIQDRVECPDCRWTGQQAQLGLDNECPVCKGPGEPRADDNEENFLSRHSEFVTLTKPVIEHYRGLNLLSACDATAPQDEVTDRLLGVLPAARDGE